MKDNMLRRTAIAAMAVLTMSIVTTLTASAQTAREEIGANKFLAGSNYLDYDRQLPTTRLTPAPKGYKPFYMSHYGRHGSRWLISKDSYTSVLEPLRKARDAGKLTADGLRALQMTEKFVEQTPVSLPVQKSQADVLQQRLGDLTTVGLRQHHGIGKRMALNFPEIFKSKGVAIDARSTVVNRCILSMMAECEELQAANQTARIHNDVSEAMQYYLNQDWTGLVKAYGDKERSARSNMLKRMDISQLMGRLFTDRQWASKNINGHKFVASLFDVTVNMQSHDTDIDMYSLFTKEELYELWKLTNAGWYISYGPSPLTGGVMPFSQRNLLRNIIETADTVSGTQATLRFGHEVCVMPLACLMELDSCGTSVSDIDQIDTNWRNYRIFPMACNIQMIFYTKGKKTTTADDVLVKVLLNERECSLPIKAVSGPYYRWSELRKYYLQKLDNFDQRQKAYEAVAASRELPDYSKRYIGLPVTMAAVTPPSIPDRVVALTEFGATGNGQTLCTEAFAKALSQLAAQGGGTVYVPQGVWLTGPIEMLDNTCLHLDKNAIILFSPDKRLYINKKKKQSRALPCIYADNKHDIAITGSGIIDGNGQQWRPVKRSKVSDVEWKLFHDMGGTERQNGQLWYPWQMKSGMPDISDSPEKQEAMRNDLVRMTDCRNLMFSGVTFQNSPRFHVHPCYSENIIIDGITVRCPWNAQNGDAIDLSDCHRTLIVNSTVDAGDDGLCMKSGKPRNGSISGVEDVLIEDNTVFHAHGAFVLGSETAAGVRRVVVRNCRFSGTDTGLRFKSGVGRGGRTEQLFISNCVMTDITGEAVTFQCDYVNRPAGSDPNAEPTFTEEQKKWAPQFQDIHISNIVCRGAHTALKAAGIQGLECIKDIDISNSTFTYTSKGMAVDEATATISLDNVTFTKQ